ncbi:MAG: hypothetical protein LBU42_02535 [Prevotellaceae bacterium]|jgi:hypothetical protein|nr:hypothetical protein [Prevotellaceae bacterium]
MKKILFLFTMLASIAASAQRTTPVTIANTKVDYSTTKTVTFDLSWKGSDATHRDEVWVFVDIQPITGANTLGSWSPATLVPGATTITGGNGNQYSSLTYTEVSGNTRGLWVKGTASNATSIFAATVKVTLANGTPAKFNACAYATDYPPNATSYNSGTYTLKGTQAFIINGTTISGDKYSGNINSLTDPTGCPGCIAIRDFDRISANVNIPCCPNLTAAGNYCRDLNADNASTYTSCGIELSKTLINGTCATQSCPTGWRFPNETEIQCLYANKNALEIPWTAPEYCLRFTNPSGSCANSGCISAGESYTNCTCLSFDGIFCHATPSMIAGRCYRTAYTNGFKSFCVR